MCRLFVGIIGFVKDCRHSSAEGDATGHICRASCASCKFWELGIDDSSAFAYTTFMPSASPSAIWIWRSENTRELKFCARKAPIFVKWILEWSWPINNMSLHHGNLQYSPTVNIQIWSSTWRGALFYYAILSHSTQTALLAVIFFQDL